MESNDTVDDAESHTHACERMCCYCCRQSGHLVTKSTRANRPHRFIYFSIFFFQLKFMWEPIFGWARCSNDWSANITHIHCLLLLPCDFFFGRWWWQFFKISVCDREWETLVTCGNVNWDWVFSSHSRYFVHVGKMVSEWIDETISVLQNERKSHHVQVHMAYFYLA